MSEYYSIYVGSKRPAHALVGFLEKNQGQTIIKGDAQEIPLEVGAHGFSNYSKVWARRVIPGADTGNKIINIEDPNYKGDLEFLKYGDPKGYPVEIRYLDTSMTLDLQFQLIRLKIILKPDEDKWYIRLPAGENRFDSKTHATYIQFLKVHHMNKDSKSKSPNATGTMYEEISEDNMDMTGIKTRESKGDAIFLVKNASLKVGQIKSLFQVVGNNENSKIDIRASEQEIYNGLLEMADNDPKFILDRIDSYKKVISDLFEKAKAFSIIDLAKHGQIALEDKGKKEILLDKVPGNGNQEKILMWLFENFLNEDIFKALGRLKDVCDAIK